MDTIRDITNGIDPIIFTYLIVIDIVIGSLWAAKRLYDDYHAPRETDDKNHITVEEN